MGRLFYTLSRLQLTMNFLPYPSRRVEVEERWCDFVGGSAEVGVYCMQMSRKRGRHWEHAWGLAEWQCGLGPVYGQVCVHGRYQVEQV